MIWGELLDLILKEKKKDVFSYNDIVASQFPWAHVLGATAAGKIYRFFGTNEGSF